MDAGRESLVRWSLPLAFVLLVPGLQPLDEPVRRTYLAALLCVAFLGYAVRPRRRAPRSALLLAGLALALGVGALWRPARALDAFPTYALFALLAASLVVASKAVDSPRRAAAATEAATLVGVLAAVWCLGERLAGGPGVGPFGRPGVAGPTFAALVPFAASAAWAAGPRARTLAPLALLLAGIASSESRTAVLAAAAGVLVAAFVGRAPRRFALWAGAVVVVGIGGIAALRPDAFASETVRVRAGLARASATLVAERPLTGHGPGSFATEVLRVRDADEARLSRGARPLAAHDDVLHLAVEGGVPAALALLALVALALRLAVRARSGPLAGALAAIAAAALAEDPFLESPTLVLFALAAGAAAGCASPARPPSPTGSRVAFGLGSLALAATALVLRGHASAETSVVRYADAVAGPTTPAKARDAARAWLARLVEPRSVLDPLRHPAAHYRWGVHRAGVERDPDGARWAFEQALRVDPGMTEARLDLAEIARLEDRPEEARAILAEAARVDPTRFDVPLRLGHLVLGPEPGPGQPTDADALVEALRLYGQAERLDPTRFETPVARARVFRRRGNLGQAERELQAAQALSHDAPETVLEGFRLAEAQGVPRELLRGVLLDRVLARAGLAQAFAVAREAERFLHLGRAAEEEALVAAAPQRRAPDLRRTNALYDAATLRFEGLLVSGLADPKAVREAAAADAKDGRHRRALARFRALFATPAGAVDPDLILEAARSAMRADPAEWRRLSAWGHTLLGDELLGKGDVPGALRSYDAAVEKEPATPAAHVGRARAYARAGRTEEARASLRTAIGHDPSFAERARADPDLRPLVE